MDPPIKLSIESLHDTSYFSEEFTKMDVGKPSHRESPSHDQEKLFTRFSFNADLEFMMKEREEQQDNEHDISQQVLNELIIEIEKIYISNNIT